MHWTTPLTLLLLACIVVDGPEQIWRPELPPTDYDGTTTATYGFQDGDTEVLGPDPVEESVIVVFDDATGEMVIETHWCTVVAQEWDRFAGWVDATVDTARTVCRLPAGEGEVQLTVGLSSFVRWHEEGLEIMIEGTGTWNGLTSDVLVDFAGVPTP